jgi:polysaccharide deacetylase 2 family uncharacterized protein YibQ
MNKYVSIPIQITILLLAILIPAHISHGEEIKQFKAAIIIDDFGGGGTGGVEKFLEGGIPITAAVMPYTEKSKKHAEWAHRNGIEVMIHLPMQAKTGKRSWLGPKPITIDLTPEEVKKRVYEAIETVPYAKGLNNHMGSLAVENEKIVRPIVEVAKERNLFIVDSGTSPNSKFPEIAKEMGVPILKRDVFLDDICSVSHVNKQMNKLAKIVEIKGQGIAIGHVGLTGKVCSIGVYESMKEFKKRQIKVVFVSELLTNELMKKNFLP